MPSVVCLLMFFFICAISTCSRSLCTFNRFCTCSYLSTNYHVRKHRPVQNRLDEQCHSQGCSKHRDKIKLP